MQRRGDGKDDQQRDTTTAGVYEGDVKNQRENESCNEIDCSSCSYTKEVTFIEAVEYDGSF